MRITGQHQPVLAQRDTIDRVVDDGLLHHTQLHGFHTGLFQDRVGIEHPNRAVEAAQRLGHHRQCDRQQHGRRGVRECDGQRLTALAHAGNLLAGVAPRAIDAGRRTVQQPSSLGRRHIAFGIADEQRRPDHALQLGDARRHRGLRDLELVGGQRELADLVDRDQSVQQGEHEPLLSVVFGNACRNVSASVPAGVADRLASFDLRDPVAADHERRSRHVDHRLVEPAVGVELVDDRVRADDFAEPFRLVRIEIQTGDPHRPRIHGG